jgi:hypothetical protein
MKKFGFLFALACGLALAGGYAAGRTDGEDEGYVCTISAYSDPVMFDDGTAYGGEAHSSQVAADVPVELHFQYKRASTGAWVDLGVVNTTTNAQGFWYAFVSTSRMTFDGWQDSCAYGTGDLRVKAVSNGGTSESAWVMQTLVFE